jgi:hypothetical protein
MSKKPMDGFFSVFNMEKKDKLRADIGFIKRFDQETFDRKILPIHEAGIMSIFDSPPNKWTLWYIEAIAFLVNERRGN